MKVIVLGAGVIGVTTAYFLARAGHEVVVLEKASASACGCSYGNGGQLSYSHIETWAAKASFLSLLKAAVLPNSFLSIANFSDKEFWRWAFRFARNSFAKKAHENSNKLFSISSYSKEMLSQIMAAEPELQFDYKQSGILHFYRNEKKFFNAIKEAELHSEIGCNSEVISPEECVKKEPTLIRLLDEGNLVGGIFYKDDASGNSALFTKSLAEICKNKYGVTFEYGCEVKNIFTNYQKITGINTNKDVFSADKYVYCLGAYGNDLLKGIGIYPKIYPLKGYSLSIPTNYEFLAPNIALTDPENKIVYSRFENTFRAAGTVEIDSLHSYKNEKMLKFLSNVLCSTFSDFGNINQSQEWYGFRPFRPNSIPLICEAKKYGNLLLNVGHGSLGWTLSAASGSIISNIISGYEDKRFEFLEKEERNIYSK